MKLELEKYCRYFLVLLILLPQVISAKPRRFDPETDQMIKDRLLSLESVIDVRYSDEVRDKLFFYLKKHKEASEVTLGKLPMYLPIFAELVREKNLPKELAYLPIVETDLFVNAVSPVGATGLWQIMKPTAESLGLRMSRQVDERKDPIKATDAALDYLAYLHAIYDDWGVALAAYNCGMGNVNKAISKSGGGNTFWQLKQYLPKETQQYVPKLIAIMYMVKHYADHGLKPKYEQDLLIHTTVAKVRYRIDLKEMAEKMDLDYGLLSRLNPSYSKGVIPINGDDNYVILPYCKLNIFVEEFGDIENIVMTNSSFAHDEDTDLLYAYTASDDAQREEILIANVAYANRRNNSLPSKENPTDFYLKNASIINDRTYRYVKLSSRQSLREIANNYGVELATIMVENNYSGENLPRLGDMVKVPM
ncbi:MAG: transglycosylase SLT domain-containing protein [Saprospiraceae bacterium]|nr:transglycosylase SLT domain-containing protein [Saprospiraceae bacterium]